jgi:predicted RNA-binding protein
MQRIAEHRGRRQARFWPSEPDRNEVSTPLTFTSVGTTWILTGSLDNFRATREHDFRLIGAKERRRGLAEQIEPGDEIAFYVTGVQAFGGIVRVTGEMYEDRAKVWPGKPGKVDTYPWRFETEPVTILEEHAFVPAEELVEGLEHVRKWPLEHWHLAFQGQLRAVSESDARLLTDRIRQAAAAYSAA